MPRSRQVRSTRRAISPRLATRTLRKSDPDIGRTLRRAGPRLQADDGPADDVSPAGRSLDHACTRKCSEDCTAPRRPAVRPPKAEALAASEQAETGRRNRRRPPPTTPRRATTRSLLFRFLFLVFGRLFFVVRVLGDLFVDEIGFERLRLRIGVLGVFL